MTMTMTRSTVIALAAAGTALAAGVAYAAAPKTLTGVAGGLWEVDGTSGSKGTIKACFADPLLIAYNEHGKVKCVPTILNDVPPNLRVRFQCGASDFGQANIKTVTPRSLRVEVQGIADGAPYAYVMQARRVGDCPAAGGAKKAERGGH